MILANKDGELVVVALEWVAVYTERKMKLRWVLQGFIACMS